MAPLLQILGPPLTGARGKLPPLPPPPLRDPGDFFHMLHFIIAELRMTQATFFKILL
jgi:hypothetical protein